jgi:3-mercaptopyruvate sulfurtransferase SseA
MLPSEATFTAFLKLHNIKPSSTRVILYDQKSLAQPFWATRAYWMF